MTYLITYTDMDNPGIHKRYYSPIKGETKEVGDAFVWEMDANGFSVYEVISVEEVTDSNK